MADLYDAFWKCSKLSMWDDPKMLHPPPASDKGKALGLVCLLVDKVHRNKYLKARSRKSTSDERAFLCFRTTLQQPAAAVDHLALLSLTLWTHFPCVTESLFVFFLKFQPDCCHRCFLTSAWARDALQRSKNRPCEDDRLTLVLDTRRDYE